MLTLDGERTVEMLLDEDHAESQPALSPDGRWLIHQSGPTGQGIIYVQPFPAVGDGKWLVSPSVVASSPVWSPDGRELFFATPLEVLSARVETEPSFTARAPEPLFDVTPCLGVGDSSTSRRTGTASSSENLRWQGKPAKMSPSTASFSWRTGYKSLPSASQ